MSVLAIACDNCGAKYRLPESFSGDKAKCQKCGSVIDVAAQRKAAAAPAPIAQPKAAAAPKEETVAKKPAARPARTEAKADAAPAARSRRSDKAAESKAEKAPRGRKDGAEREPKKSNTMLLAGGGIAALAIVAVIVVLASGGKDKAKGTETAQASAAPKAVDTPAAAPKDASTDKPVAVDASANQKPVAVEAAVTPAVAKAVEQKPAEPKTEQQPAAKKPVEAKPAEATPTPKAEEKPAEAKPAAGGNEPKERWEANKTTKLEDVYSPSVLGDVTWPAECEQAQKDEIVSLIEDVCNGGKPGISAKPKLEKIGYYAIFGIIDRLRKFDYKSGDDQMTAYEFNQILETITSGINCGFVPVESGGDLDPRKADHNARTNEAWTRLLTKHESKAAFDAWRKERQNKNK